MPSSLDLIKSSSPLHILHLSSGKAHIYFAKLKGATLVEPSSGLQQASDLALFAAQWPSVPRPKRGGFLGWRDAGHARRGKDSLD
jgi:hypothetical protein